MLPFLGMCSLLASYWIHETEPGAFSFSGSENNITDSIVHLTIFIEEATFMEDCDCIAEGLVVRITSYLD